MCGERGGNVDQAFTVRNPRGKGVYAFSVLYTARTRDVFTPCHAGSVRLLPTDAPRSIEFKLGVSLAHGAPAW